MASRFICLVTGGASGLGKATVHRLVRHGARVVIADLPSSDGENVAKEFGENCTFSPTDVSVNVCMCPMCRCLSVNRIYLKCCF